MEKSKKWIWLEAFVLCYINLINYMDRLSLSGILDKIEKEFNITDEWKLGLLQTAFVACFCLVTPCIGFFGDRYSRKYLMIMGVLAWSSCTLISSFMTDYVSFLMMRSAVGFGEACFTTLAPTVLGDMFQEHQRTIVLAIFYFAIPVGGGLGYITGSQIAELTGDWRWGVRFTSILSLLGICIMSLVLNEPTRGVLSHIDVSLTRKRMTMAEKVKSFGNDILYLFRNKSYMICSLAFTCLSFSTGALTWWGPNYLKDALIYRVATGTNELSDPSQEQASLIFGIIMVVSGLTGLALGSSLSYTLRPKYKWIDPALCGVGLLIASPLIFTGIYLVNENVVLALILLSFGEVFLNMNWALVVDISLYVVVPTKRSSAEAFQLMVAHGLGEAGSPYLIGLIVDAFKSPLDQLDDPISSAQNEFEATRNALFLTIITIILGGLSFLLVSMFVVQDWSKALAEEIAMEKQYRKFQEGGKKRSIEIVSMEPRPQI